VLLAALLPLALAGFGAWIVFGSLFEQRSLESLRGLVRAHARTIDADLSEHIRLLQVLAASQTRTRLADDAQLDTLLAELNRAGDNSFTDLGVIDAEGDHLAYAGPFDLKGRNYRGDEWFGEAMERGVSLSDVFLGFRGAPHCVIAVRAGNAAEGFWILRGTINSARFDTLVQAGKCNGGDAYIVSRRGLYQTASRRGALLDTARGIPLVPHEGAADYRATLAGTDLILLTAWLQSGRWLLVVEQDRTALRAPVNQAITRGAQVVLIAVLILIVTTVIATRHLCRQIDRANAQREELSRAFVRSARLASIGELATGLAHEINNPLAVISAEHTNLADLLRASDLPEPTRGDLLESVERCRRQVQRCAGITRKMLQFGRRREAAPEPTDITPRLQEIIALLRRRAGVRNVALHLETAAGLRPVLVDPIEFEQVIVNLINNAVDALPGGGDVWVRAGAAGDRLRIEVADNGVGIPADTLERIFEPFYTTKPVGQGTGLGLSVCYGLVGEWGGRITAESAVGRGTTMRVELPLPHPDNSTARP